jgi:hypothetical protein
MSETATYLELARYVARGRLQGEDGFSPLRAPMVERETRREDSAPEATELRAEDIAPGMRRVNGRWFYSAAWL